MAKPKEIIGTIGCYSCSKEVPVKQSESGTLSFPCPWCDFPAYAKVGTEAHTIAAGRMKKAEEPVPVPETTPVTTPAPEKKPFNVFGG
jgi:hypothetical protein